MIHIPPDVFFGTTLKVGIVYYFHADTLVRTSESHFFVVLGYTDSVILSVCATTKITERKRFSVIKKLPPQTLVEVEPDAVSNGLTKLSLFDCNFIHEHSIHYLSEKHEKTHIHVTGEMPGLIVERLISGALASPLVTREKKRIIRPT